MPFPASWQSPLLSLSLRLYVQRKPPSLAAALPAHLSGITDNEISGDGKEMLNSVDIPNETW